MTTPTCTLSAVEALLGPFSWAKAGFSIVAPSQTDVCPYIVHLHRHNKLNRNVFYRGVTSAAFIIQIITSISARNVPKWFSCQTPLKKSQDIGNNCLNKQVLFLKILQGSSTKGSPTGLFRHTWPSAPLHHQSHPSPPVIYVHLLAFNRISVYVCMYMTCIYIYNMHT